MLHLNKVYTNVSLKYYFIYLNTVNLQLQFTNRHLPDKYCFSQALFSVLKSTNPLFRDSFSHTATGINLVSEL